MSLATWGRSAWFPFAFRLSLPCRGREATGQKVQMFVRLGIGLPVIPDVVNPNASMSQGWNDGGRAIRSQLSVGF